MKEIRGTCRSSVYRYLITLGIMVVAMIAFTAMSYAAEASVSVPVKTTGYEAQLEKTYTINHNSRLDKTYAGKIIPLVVSSPGTIQVNILGQRIDNPMDVEIYTDASCTNRLPGLYAYLEPNKLSKDAFVGVSRAGTYYLKMSTYSSTSNPKNFTNTIKIGLGEYTNSVKTLNTKVRYYRAAGKDIHRFKYTANKTGKVYVTVGSAYGVYVKLEDANKKALNSSFAWVSKNNDLHKGRIGYAVKKGKTYHFAVKAIASDELQTISVSSVTTVKEKSGAKLKKAKKLKAKKKANGTLLPGEKKADWYKIKLSKRKKLTITVTGEPNTDENYKDGFKITVYSKKGKKVGSINMKSTKVSGKVTYGTKYGYADKGTYYVKISPLNKNSSGFYTLSWK